MKGEDSAAHPPAGEEKAVRGSWFISRKGGFIMGEEKELVSRELMQEALMFGRKYVRYGKKAGYIEELAKGEPTNLGLAM